MPTDPTGRVVRNIFDLRRLENELGAQVINRIEDLFNEIVALIAKIDPTSPAQETYRRLRVDKLMDEIEALAGDTFEEIFRVSRESLVEIGSQQAEWSRGTLRTALSGVDIDIETRGVGVNLFRAILREDPIQGFLLESWFEGQGEKVVRDVRREIQIGMANNETIDDMVRRVRGRQEGFLRRDPSTGQFVPRGTKGADIVPRFRGGVMSTTTREATAIVRTSVNHIANAAHHETYKQNADIVTRVEFVAVLDSRTSDICMAHDGLMWPVDSDEIERPPLHPNCRSLLQPIIDWDGIGVSEPPESTRASADGQIPASTRYSDWLKDQPADVQDDIIGPGRARLFRAGKITLRDLVRKDNSRVTLEDLRKRAA